MRRTTVLLAALAMTASIGLAACGDDAATDATGTPTPTATASSPPTNDGGSSGAKVPKVTGAVGKTPKVAKPVGDPPDKVLSKDLVVGTGTEAQAGSNVTVDYHLVKWDDGSVVESSFESGQPATFALNGLIPCWQEGIPGMKEGGRRVLVCTPESAYGPAGGGSPLSGQTLVFVIDLKTVNS